MSEEPGSTVWKTSNVSNPLLFSYIKNTKNIILLCIYAGIQVKVIDNSLQIFNFVVVVTVIYY